MGDVSPLPRDTLGDDMGMKCPWCGSYVEEAFVCLEAIVAAWQHGELEVAPRCDDGTASECALSADCPTCAHPFMVALKDGSHGRYARLLAVRTKADAALIGGAA